MNCDIFMQWDTVTLKVNEKFVYTIPWVNITDIILREKARYTTTLMLL